MLNANRKRAEVKLRNWPEITRFLLLSSLRTRCNLSATCNMLMWCDVMWVCVSRENQQQCSRNWLHTRWQLCCSQSTLNNAVHHPYAVLPRCAELLFTEKQLSLPDKAFLLSHPAPRPHLLLHTQFTLHITRTCTLQPLFFRVWGSAL